ncbi:MAG: SufE family protein [Candidatus Kapabacteria bacterium]|nr:SufE family protein [Candidatus Kapabacteria bacterium]
MTIEQNITKMQHEFDSFPDWEERYAHIIAVGKGLAPYNEEYLKDEFKVKGCQSQVWLHSSINGGRVRFEAESDALIVKGLVALLLRLFNDRTPKEILEAPVDLVSRLGFEQHLSQNRANGLASMLKQIKLYALAYSMVKA